MARRTRGHFARHRRRCAVRHPAAARPCGPCSTARVWHQSWCGLSCALPALASLRFWTVSVEVASGATVPDTGRGGHVVPHACREGEKADRCSSLWDVQRSDWRETMRNHRHYPSHGGRRHAGARWPRGGSEERVHPRRLGHALRGRRPAARS